MKSEKTINQYIIRQTVNSKVISFLEVECTYEDYKALCSILLLPNENEIIESCDLITIMGEDKESLKKQYFNKVALNPNVQSETIIYEKLKNRAYNGIKFQRISLFNWVSDVPMRNLIKQGRDFEQFVAQLYQKQGYTIIKNYEKGKEDEGIDIIAYYKEELLLIQCKNWKIALVTQKEIKEFLGSCYIFLYKYSHYRKYKKVRRIFISSCKEVSQSANKLIDELDPFLEYVYLYYKR